MYTLRGEKGSVCLVKKDREGGESQADQLLEQLFMHELPRVALFSFSELSIGEVGGDKKLEESRGKKGTS